MWVKKIEWRTREWENHVQIETLRFALLHKSQSKNVPSPQKIFSGHFVDALRVRYMTYDTSANANTNALKDIHKQKIDSVNITRTVLEGDSSIV